MAYIYDILLNFNKNLIEYFEWEDNDDIKYIKKIIVFKVHNNFINDLLNNNILLDEEFVRSIPRYDMDGLSDSSSICIFTNGFIALGVLIKNFRPILLSRLLIDEETEVLDIANNLDFIPIKYINLNSKNSAISYLTRKEQDLKEKLEKEIDGLYENKKYDQLKYLYYEYSGLENNNYKTIYLYLKKSLKNFNNKHKFIYDILLLSKSNFSSRD